MAFKSLSLNLGRIFSKLSLKTILIVPYVIQILGAFGALGYIAFLNGQQTVDDLGKKLTNKISDRIQQHVLGYLNQSHQVLRITNDAIESANLDIYNFVALRRYFWEVVKEKDLQDYLFFGNEEGEFIGVEHFAEGEIYLKSCKIPTQSLCETYLLNNQGNISQYLNSKEYDPRDTPWYLVAKKLGEPTWSPILSSFSGQNSSLDIFAVQPIFDSTENLLGVLSNKTTLVKLTNFLKNLYISPNGQSFIIERSGNLIASSEVMEPFVIKGTQENRKIERLPATASENKIVSMTTKHLQQKFSSFAEITHTHEMNFPIEEEWYYASVIPVIDGRGINWLAVVVIPEDDFMEKVNMNIRTTILLSFAALTITVLLGIVTTNWITKPILQLNSAAKEISQGKWETQLKIYREDELGELANSFDQMASQLKKSFETLEAQNKQLTELDRLKDEFLANTSHELRTPLNGIIGIGEFLLEENTKNLNSITTSNLAIIVSSARRLSNLVNDILDFSKIRYHKLELQVRAIDVRIVVESVITLNRVLVGKNKNLQLTNAIPTDLPPVLADENRLQQILYNLIANAIKFTESGKVEISASLYSPKEDQDEATEIIIMVSDTGIGIPPDQLDRIFESFEQGEGSIIRKYGGTGLGLAVTKELVELQGGRIWVESEVGVGSRFNVTLPISNQLVPNSSLNFPSPTVNNIHYLIKNIETTIRSKPLGSKIPNGDFHVLVVDDEPINIQVLNNYLKANNYQVTQALSGKEALAALENNHNFDLILLDVMMPNMSGYEVCSQIREKYPAQSLPVLMLTAKNQIADLVMGFQFGANDYLTKPFAKDELLTRIQTHIKLSKITKAYERFVPHEYVELLSKESIINVKLGDRVSTEMAIFFSDIRSFTTISEQMTSQETFAFVNGYLKEVCPEIRDRNGLIIKFLGDGIMAVFPDGADDALEAAIAQLKRLQEYNQVLLSTGWMPIKIGIGIHWGHIMVGIVGEKGRMSGDAFSNNVNLTSRLEGLTKFYGVSLLISESAFNYLKNPQKYQIRFLDRASVKGIDEPINVYEVLDGEVDEIRELKLQTQVDFALGLESYRVGELVDAKDYFEKVLAVNYSDKTAQLYLERIDDLMVTGVPKNWNGVWAFTQK